MVIIISGPPGAGKSSVSCTLAEKFPKSAYIPVDDVKNMIIGGNVAPWAEKGPEQFKLVEKNFLSLARNFLDEGFVVILDYVFSDEQVKKYDQMLGDVHGFLLLPSIETLKQRDFERVKDTGSIMQKRIDVLHPEFANAEHNTLKVIDSTNQTLEETVEEIFNYV